ncbi:SRPBCC family protein [Maioricimonas sp. JC845]|uniref:SRPBCC family protein n=1 Tax=Maioricimonas sp. JC845 TaxID=3232138 RepID=UPI00345A74F4
MEKYGSAAEPPMILIERDSDEPGTYRLSTQLWLPVRRTRVFEFFSDAFQLESITPPWLQFHVLTPAPIEMHEGRRIDYALRLRGIPIRWQSEITRWESPHVFVDEQRRGPYRLWRHEHRFQEQAGGTLVIDEIRFAVPFDWLLGRWFVQPDLHRIFRHRHQRLQALLQPDRKDQHLLAAEPHQFDRVSTPS